MLRPFLFVGVGGSGGKTLRALKQTLERRLRQNDWEKGIPQAWQFLQVDTAYDGVAFPAPMLPLDEFVGLVGPGQTYQSMITNLDTKLNGPSLQQSALSGWCFPSSAVPISTGAGMIRTIGRTVSASGLANLRVALDTSVKRMQAPGAEGELNELSAKLHKGSGARSKDPVVIVISSIAGGSGAGMLLDVTETIKSIDSQSRWLQSPQAFLYTPEVFDSIPAALRAQIPMNALGAMAELMAGSWTNAPSEGSEALFLSQGVKVQRSGQKPAVGPNATYLIGSRNANGVNLAEGREGQGMDEVFMAVGEALTGLVTNEKISDDFDAYFLTNVFVASGNPAIVVDHSGLTRPGDDKERMPFGSMGFARITVGMDRLLDYATEGLVREQVQKLLFPDYEPQDPANPIRDVVLIEQEVNASIDEFVAGSLVSEGHPNDQILNALRGDNPNDPSWDPTAGRQQETGAARSRRANELALKCRQQVPEGKQISTANWRQALLSQFNLLLPKFLTDERARFEERARSWTGETQDHLVEYIAEWVSRRGLQVTAKLIRHLHDDLVNVGNQQMVREAEELRTKLSAFETALTNALGPDLPSLAGNSNQVASAMQVLQLAAERFAEAELLEYTPKMVLDVARNVLRPLAEACDISYAQLRGDLATDSNSTVNAEFNRYAELAVDRKTGWVSNRYKPRQVERVLIQPDSFPKELQGIIIRDLPENLYDSWSSLVMPMSLKGKPMRSLDARNADSIEQSLIMVVDNWIPSDSHARKEAAMGAQPLEVEIPRSVMQLLAQTRDWLIESESSFGKQYRMSIADFCKIGSTSDRLEKENGFARAFEDLIKISAPLVGVNDGALLAFHHHSNPQLNPTGNLLRLSPIPFDPRSAVGERCETALQNAQVPVAADMFDPASLTQDVYAFSTVKIAMQPMVFSSLVEPIAQSWLTSSNTAVARQAFWKGRRARPLTDAIPVSAEIRRSMIAGWFVAYFFGQRREEVVDSNLGKKVEVWSPNKNWVGFPFPLLPTAAEDTQVLPAVLKSLSLAIIEAGRSANLQPFDAYMRLKDLGREVTTPEFDMWDDASVPMSTLIEDWVKEGSLPPSAPVESALGALSEPSDPAERKARLLESVDKIIAQYIAYWSEASTASWATTPRMFELRTDVDFALSQIRSFVSMIQVAHGASTVLDA